MSNIASHEESQTKNIETLLTPLAQQHSWFGLSLQHWTLPARSLSLISFVILVGSTLLFIFLPFLLEPLLARRGIPITLAILAPLMAFWIAYAGRNRPSFSMSWLDFLWHPKVWSVLLTLFCLLVSIVFLLEPLIRDYVLPLADDWDIPAMHSLKLLLDVYLLPLVFANFLATLVLLPRLLALHPDSPRLLYIAPLSLSIIVLLLVGSLTFLKSFVYPIIEFFDPAMLTVVTTDIDGATINDAEVYINGLFAGKTPLDKKLQRGEHRVCISKAGYLSYRHDEPVVLTDRDGRLREDFEFKLTPATATIQINVAANLIEEQPVDAYLDDNYWTDIRTPMQVLEVEVGEQLERTLRLEKSDYLPVIESLYLSDKPDGCVDDTATRTVAAELRYPKLTLTAKNATGNFSVFIDGERQYRGTFPYEVSLPRDTYAINVRKGDYALCKHTTTLETDTSLECYWKLLTIQSDANTVTINDKRYSPLPVGLKIPIGSALTVAKQDGHAARNYAFVPCEFNVAEDTEENIVCDWMTDVSGCNAKTNKVECWFYLHSGFSKTTENIFVNGVPYGNAKDSRLRLPLNQSPASTYAIEFKNSGQLTCALELRVNATGLPTVVDHSSGCDCEYWRRANPPRLRCDLE